ncbi:hypothetical protein DEIGR_102574 [Deinococcus grandis]|uniref:Uncharacterized protein n=1 Tax=Deinococcus grandis TaxID=57498 RepID=A0A117DNZ5_9DEIO|nr:hypothetical protein [Deinococcus grandis]BBN93943.1 hypothetical protein DEGR_06760 [Deinococcus grandis]GAQ22547.1 hypothetical protein DEIGR_102574 [Deinococcus grandis]
MPSLRSAGFFHELGYGDSQPSQPSIHEPLDVSLSAVKDRIVAYLSQGSAYAVAAGPSFDYFQRPERRPIEGLALLTDGEWIWPSDLVHYVQHYAVAVPIQFVAHMQAQNWTPKQLTTQELMDVSRRERQ